jgi:hypothetical protein
LKSRFLGNKISKLKNTKQKNSDHKTENLKTKNSNRKTEKHFHSVLRAEEEVVGCRWSNCEGAICVHEQVDHLRNMRFVGRK